MIKKVFISFVVICVYFFISLPGCALSKYKKKIASTKINTINLEKIEDGEYGGFYDVYYLSSRVIVKVERHKIASIKLLEHKFDKYSGEPMIRKVLDSQSLNVDSISGATNSCKTVLKSIEVALRKGQL